LIRLPLLSGTKAAKLTIHSNWISVRDFVGEAMMTRRSSDPEHIDALTGRNDDDDNGGLSTVLV